MANFEDQWEEVNEDLPAEDVQEVIGVIPSSVTRWGISIVSAIIILALIGSYLFKYPDIIKTHVTLVTENPPTEIISKKSSIIEKLFVQSFDTVSKGQILAKLESTVSLDEITELKNELTKINFSDIEITTFQNFSNIGDITIEYSALLNLVDDYKSFQKINYHPKKIELYKSRFQIQSDINKKLIKKRKYLEQRLSIEKDAFIRDSILTTKDNNSRKDLMISNSEYLKNQALFEDLLIEIESLQLQMQETKEQILNNKNQLESELIQYKTRFLEIKKKIESKIENWEEQNLLIAQQDGQIIFTSVWSEKQFVQANEKVFTIIPQNGGEIIGRLNMPSFGSGKVKQGQKVVIKLDDFPYRKYGSLEGIVDNISKISEKNEANQSTYIVEIKLNKSMKTNYDQNLDFTQNMTGLAEIITEENRLLEKIYLPIKDIISTKL